MGCVKKREVLILLNLDIIKKNYDLLIEKIVRIINGWFGRGDIFVCVVLWKF